MQMRKNEEYVHFACLLSLKTNNVLNLIVYANAKGRVRTGAYNKREEKHDAFKADKKTYNRILMFHIVMLLAYEIPQPPQRKTGLIRFHQERRERPCA